MYIHLVNIMEFCWRVQLTKDPAFWPIKDFLNFKKCFSAVKCHLTSAGKTKLLSFCIYMPTLAHKTILNQLQIMQGICALTAC